MKENFLNKKSLPSAETQSSPFGEEQTFRPRMSLGFLLLLLVVNAVLSLLLLFASQVPALSNVINDFWGLPRADVGKTDRTTHLIFLISCYSAPLAMTIIVSLAYKLLRGFQKPPSPEEPTDPFA
jgi:hypothetical protein